jgi:PAS domain S-box-containing protein
MNTLLRHYRLEDFLDIVMDAVILANQEQKIIFFNHSAEKLWGYSANDVVGQPLDTLIPERFIEVHHRNMSDFAVSSTTKQNMAEKKEVTARRSDGSEFPVEASIAKLIQDEDILFCIFLRDITEHKQVVSDLAKWAQAFNHAEWGVVVGEASTRNFQIMNPAFARMYGYSVEELTGKPIETVYAPPERGKLDNWLRQAHNLGYITYESRHIRRDQTEFPVIVSITAVKDPQGNVLYRVVNVTDISELKKAEQTLSEIEHLNATIVELLNEGILIIDREGHVLSSNACAEAIIGVRREEFLGMNIHKNDWVVIHEDGSPCEPVDYPSWKTITTGMVCKNVVLGILQTGGSIQWVSVSTHPLIHKGESEPYAAFISFGDITERIQMYRLMEDRVKEKTRELSALLEVSRILVSTLDLAPLMKSILVQLKRVVDYTGAAIARLDGGDFFILEYLGPVAREYMLKFRIPAEYDTGYSRVMLSGKAYIINDMWENDPWLFSMQQLTSSQLVDAMRPSHSWMGVPLIAQDQFLGILRMDHIQPYFFTERHADLVTAFAGLAAIAIRNADLYEHAQSLAALEERQKLARDLHDSVSQALYGIALGARTARTLIDRDPIKAVDPLDYCLYLAETGLTEMRSLIFELRPESLEKEGLINALSKHVSYIRARYQLSISVDFGSEPLVSLNLKETIYRIAQEALNNVVKHAKATHVGLRLVMSDEGLMLEIHDNGRGFDTTIEKAGHIGLISMRERAQRIGASLTIESDAGKGALVRLIVKAPK